MSERDDKPDPEAGNADTQAKPSLFDSSWDALLGSSASGPTFAPPKPAGADVTPAKPSAGPSPDDSGGETLPAANSAPRTSEAAASVSGEFLAPEPRPEPKSPPRYEPPEGVTPDYASADEETAESHPILPPPGSERGPDTEDDEDHADAPDPAKVIALAESRESTRTNTPSGDKPRARAAEEEAEAEPERGGAGKLVIVAALAAAGLLVVFVGKSRDTQRDTKSASASKVEGQGPATTGPSKPDAGPKPGTTDGGSGTESGETETGGDESGGETDLPRPATPKPHNIGPRDPSLIPPNTPEENAKAFTKLPVSIHDGPPIGGIGRTGIHVDAISTSRGRDNTECDQPTATFSIGIAKYVNVCFRAVHPREQESLRVIWEKDGKVTRRGRVRIPDLHAYTTRAYLLLRPEYVGDWRVRIVPEGEESIDLAVAEFVITE